MKGKISAVQLMAAVVLVPYGSAVLFLMPPYVKQDAWIVILIYLIPAILLQLIYTSLWKNYPRDTLVTYMPKIFGKLLGTFLSIIYIVFFAYEAARVVRDFSSLITISSMPTLNVYFVTLLLMIVMGYCAYLGMEVLCRSAHIFLYMWVIFFIMECIFLFATPNILKFKNLQPILETGVLPLVTKSWKLLCFPFGEMILLTMFYPFVNPETKVRKAVVLATVLEAVFLSLNNIIFISALGADFSSNSLFPLLQTLRLIKIGEAFDRFDIFIILIMLLAGVTKVSFYMYGSMLGFSQLIKQKSTKKLAIPFSIIVGVASLLIAKNYPQHIYIGHFITLPYIHLPLTIIIPTVAMFIIYIKKLFKVS
ncbi:MAG: GerAB/ArcD/ProY family transporter [Clostridiaceae bacterium]